MYLVNTFSWCRENQFVLGIVWLSSNRAADPTDLALLDSDHLGLIHFSPLREDDSWTFVCALSSQLSLLLEHAGILTAY